jgi:polyphosphate kinase
VSVNQAELTDFDKPENFVDRELSWLAFNDRVVEEAEDPSTPLLEQLKFLGIASSNLDEFFMVRVSGIQEQVLADVRTPNFAGHTPEEKFDLVHQHAHEQTNRVYRCLSNEVLPALEKENIRFLQIAQLNKNQQIYLREYFDQEVFPVLTPLAVDSGHPFPQLRNLSLNLAVLLQSPHGMGNGKELFAVVQVPHMLNRVVQITSKQDCYEFILLEDLISADIQLLFPGMVVKEVRGFRVTRDADIEFAEEEADDLLKSIEEELRQRERGSAVRLGIEKNASSKLVEQLRGALKLQPMQVYQLDGPIDLSDVAKVSEKIPRPDLKFKPFVPSVRPSLRKDKNIFETIARKDILLHHPYEAFTPVSEFIRQAAQDPNVLAIKQTLYRTSGDSEIAKALMEAAENGKQVAALLELKARFDEERNIGWAKQMERAGVHVVYGLVGLKTHAKVCMVVRREGEGIRRYVHLGTGNYNPITARLYTDLGLLTCDPDLCDDASELFNQLTGYSRLPQWRKMVVAPLFLRKFFIEGIEEQTRLAQEGKPARIRAKMNSLVDPEIAAYLYKASCTGVQIELIVRGICCLRPGIEGLSENIKVYSTVGRFLEHSRIFIFGNGDKERVYLSSADWMPRNLDRRIETLFPIEDPRLKDRVINEVWQLSVNDTVKRRVLCADGSYIRIKPQQGARIVHSQQEFLNIEQGIRQDFARDTVAPEMLVHSELANGELPNPSPIQPAKPAARHLDGPSEENALEVKLHVPLKED